MMRQSLLISILLLWKQASVKSVHLVELRVPGHAAVGGEALLGCEFDTAGDTLYSVKWYKDGREFYRFVPRNKKPALRFATQGVHVDMSRSSSDVVTLTNLQQKSEGLYRCEVSGEAPLFSTAAGEKYVSIHILPETSPQVTGLHHAYRIGERLVANCTSGPSKPEAQVKWVVNGKPARKEHLRGPWYRAREPPDATEIIVQLNFKVLPVHFRRGVMEVKCQATIAPLYHQEVLYRVAELKKTIPSLSSSKENDVIETTTTMYEGREFKRDPLYELRERLYGGRDLHTTSLSTLPPDNVTPGWPVSQEEQTDNIIYPKINWPTDIPTFSTDQDTSDGSPNAAVGLERSISTLGLIIYFLFLAKLLF